MIGSVSLSFKIIDFSGTMDFEEYIMAINCTNFTEPKDKLTWMFNCFDEVSIIYYDATSEYHLTCLIRPLGPLSGTLSYADVSSQ